MVSMGQTRLGSPASPSPAVPLGNLPAYRKDAFRSALSWAAILLINPWP